MSERDTIAMSSKVLKGDLESAMNMRVLKKSMKIIVIISRSLNSITT